ncbi:hypothetical protein wTkk_001127 [Wolbachia endosymbiont of Trichogramma kaykai]
MYIKRIRSGNGINLRKDVGVAIMIRREYRNDN